MGEAPDSIVLVEIVEEAEALELPDRTRVAYVTQTTLSVDETARSSPCCARRFPAHRRARSRRTSATRPRTASGR